tara:strand:+ start:23 stop:646 length:624 start_codon:yes stop_codon:yes gene_type:complete
MLIAKDLSFKRNEKTIFRDINISLSKNQIVQIKGRNGSGKTTLIKILSNILQPSNGDIYWQGKNTNKNRNIFYKNLTLVLDTNTSKRDLTLNENIQFWKRVFASKIEDNEISSLLEFLEIDEYKKVLVKYLSFGEIRKLELCRLVIEQKKLWLLDEPYLGLDESVTEILKSTFESHIKNGGMIIFTSHFSPQISKIQQIDLENYANN